MGVTNRPRRIILVRHGESQGNVDDAIYETVPDHALTLTSEGTRAGDRGGPATARIPRFGAPVTVYASPYVRTRQTVDALGLGVPSGDVRIEPRLREQDWANFQDPADIAEQKRLRNEYGHFYYRFTHGESGSDVYDRVSTFLESLWRYIEADPAGPHGHPMSDQNLVIVTHGLTMRLFCMRWFHWSVEYFESLENPVNGGYVALVRQPDLKYQLEEAVRPVEPGLRADRARTVLLALARSPDREDNMCDAADGPRGSPISEPDELIMAERPVPSLDTPRTGGHSGHGGHGVAVRDAILSWLRSAAQPKPKPPGPTGPRSTAPSGRRSTG